MNLKFIYKICSKNEWADAQKKGSYTGGEKDLDDGYIHCSSEEQLETTLKKFFLDQKDLLLLKIETLKLDNLLWEQASDGNIYPHLHSSFDISHVSKVYKVYLNDDGSHKLPTKI
jgi:uncharacterized protein (DUF952 family)